MRRFLLLAVTGISLISGCATTQQLSDQDRKRIAYVRIDSNIQKAQQMYYLDPVTSAGMSFGLIGALIVAGASEAPRQALQEYAEKNGVHIEKIVHQELDSAIRQSNKLPVSEGPGPDGGTIKVFVSQYGFSVPHGLSTKLVPILAVRCEMTDASGKVIWQASDRVLTIGNPAEAVSIDEMRENPKAIESAWRAAAKAIARSIVNDL